MMAAGYGNRPMVALLLERGAKADVRDRSGAVALDYALTGMTDVDSLHVLPLSDRHGPRARACQPGTAAFFAAMGENEGVRVTPALVLLLALPLYADRVRVVVVTEPTNNAIRANVISALDRATDIEPWGDSPAFAAEIDARISTRSATIRACARSRSTTAAAPGSPRVFRSSARTPCTLQGIDGRGTTVAVLDSGIDTDHPAFAGRIAGEACFCDNLNGTGCCPGGVDRRASAPAPRRTIRATARTSPGSCRESRRRRGIVAVKVLDAANRFQSFTQIYRALEWIADNRPDVDAINMSLGSDALLTDAECGSFAIAWGLQPVIARLRERGVLIAASSGNNGATDQHVAARLHEPTSSASARRSTTRTPSPDSRTAARRSISSRPASHHLDRARRRHDDALRHVDGRAARGGPDRADEAGGRPRISLGLDSDDPGEQRQAGHRSAQQPDGPAHRRARDHRRDAAEAARPAAAHRAALNVSVSPERRVEATLVRGGTCRHASSRRVAPRSLDSRSLR